MSDAMKACSILNCSVYDLISYAWETLPEDIRDVVDTRDVFRLYVERRYLPDWVNEYAVAVQWVATELKVP